MAHIALYRSWRPQRFQEIVGQQHITQTLQNALREGRVTHAYLFSGPRGTGKTSAAKVLSKAVNCERGPAEEPCNECDACIRITSGSVMDVIEIDAASNRGVEEIRDIRDKVKYAPTEVRYKVYIIDEVHMLTTEAFNALLKTLEEPPAHVMFILATTEPHRLPATIISRCQRFDFRRISLQDQVDRLSLISKQEGIEAAADALEYIARLSDGGMRDAVSLLDQIISFTGNRISYQDVLDVSGGVASEQFAKLAASVARQEIGDVLEQIDVFMQDGKSAEKLLENLIYCYRDILMLKLLPNAARMTDRLLNVEAFGDVLDLYDKERIFRYIDILNHYQAEMKYSVQPQTLFEVAMMKLCSLDLPEPGASSARSNVQAGTSAGAGEVARLELKVNALEQKIEQLLQSGVKLAGGDIGNASAEAKNQPRSTVRASAPSTLRTAKLDEYVLAKDHPDVQKILGQWSKTLQRVKETKITVHAWFTDGELVSATDDAVLVAFKNTIHRETTEKALNKQVIEQVLQEVYGKPLKLVTVMQKDWKDAASDSKVQAPQEVLQLEPEGGEASGHGQDWINEAISLFGEDLVVIKDE
ncbi:DNA polymerase III subunit gamma/tau [Paenibacillus swuensis]|uniref:DNA-directed DNA polymerase n=1 Tax=Paenibacillus swuensis TaxID=1178515 RepID=A0A172TFS6_9BACL|nr:DNA polymerase III subunit gamma/tau [Paenibacillus swuensis]ANE45891.1 DNA polymerase III subunit gamma/tau [Paenibacillus swuensis]